MRANTYWDPNRRVRCTECGVTEDLCLCQNVCDRAHERLWSPTGLTVRQIWDELASARRVFPENEHMLAALVEKVGELAQALIDHSRGSKTAPELYKEAIQVACMAIRVATEGDASFPYDPDFEIFKSQ